MKRKNQQQHSRASVSLWSELKRRKVTRVAVVYTFVGWLVIQVAAATFPSLFIPGWALSLVIMFILLGFPLALIITWAFELTPDGIKTTKVARAQAVETEECENLTRKRNRYTLLFAAAIPTLIFGALALVFYMQGSSVTSEGGRQAHVSVAVLPLINMSSVADNAFFAGGVHEDILTNLSRIQGLKVISRTSAMRYTNSAKSLRDIGVELGVRYIVEGSVRRINNHVRVTVQLIDARDDKHVWANNYDRELIDVFATQSAVAKEISHSLHLAIQPETVGVLDDMPTHSVKAYDLYIKAKSIDRSQPESELNLMERRELLEQAVIEDPDFAEAWGFLNEILDDSIRNIEQSGWFISEAVDRELIFDELSKKSLRALNKAVALAPENVEVLLAQASDSVAERKADFRAQRRKVIDHTLELYPDNAMAWYVLGWWYNLEGDNESAKPAFDRALELDPMHARIIYGSLVHFRLAGDQERVTLLFDRLAQISPKLGEEKYLGSVSIGSRVDNLLGAFMETADLIHVEGMEDEIANAVVENHLLSQVEFQFYSAALWEIQNNLEALRSLEDDYPIEGDEHFFHIFASLDLKATMVKVHLLEGRENKAQAIASELIKVEHTAGINLIQFAARNHANLAIAYAALGERAKAQQWIDRLLNERSESYNAYGLSGFIALAALDVDAAVKLILEEKQRHPTWSGTDVIATLHIFCRNILVHPDMQNYYRKEGKWLAYLADRVPEYAK